MSQGLVKTQNARLYFTTSFGASTDDADGKLILRVYCATALQNIGGGQRPQIGVTCLDSARQEYKGGLPDNEAITIPFNVAKRSRAYQALLEMFEQGSADELDSFMVVDPNPTTGLAGTAPTAIDSDGMLVSPAPTTHAVMGYISNITWEYGTNEIVRGTLTVQTSGAWVHDLPTPDLP